MRNYLLPLCLICSVFLACKKDKLIVDGPTDGEIVISTYNSKLSTPGKLLIMDKVGTILWEKTTPTAPVNFRKWTVNNKVRYTYMEFDANTPQLTPGILPTTGVVLDENFNELKRIRLLAYNGRTTSDPNDLDAHDFIYLGDNHFITLSYFQKVVKNIPASLNPVANCKVIAPIIQEIVNDQVIWEWDGSNYPEMYLQSVEGNAFSNGNVVHDYIHMNSMFIDPRDNNIICSNRNTNQVIKINRIDGRIMWRLGGTNSDFPMAAEMKFLRQHHATLVDNNQTLLLFDNGEANERPYSRVLEFQLSAETYKISTFKSYNLPDNTFAQYMGSVQKRGDTYFIGCGSTPKIMEINFVNNHLNFSKTLPDVSYRALKN